MWEWNVKCGSGCSLGWGSCSPLGEETMPQETSGASLCPRKGSGTPVLNSRESRASACPAVPHWKARCHSTKCAHAAIPWQNRGLEFLTRGPQTQSQGGISLMPLGTLIAVLPPNLSIIWPGLVNSRVSRTSPKKPESRKEMLGAGRAYQFTMTPEGPQTLPRLIQQLHGRDEVLDGNELLGGLLQLPDSLFQAVLCSLVFFRVDLLLLPQRFCSVM